MQALHEQTQTKDLDTIIGFSDRFNQLLDYAGFLSTGRITKVANFFGVSVSGARRWCKLDRPPRLKDLNSMLEALIAMNSNSVDVHSVSNWLLYGVGDPLGDSKANSGKKSASSHNENLDKNLINSLSNHQVMGQVYIAINQQAQHMKIDLYNNENLASDKLDSVIVRLIKFIKARELESESLSEHEEFMQLTESLLIVAKLSYL